MENQSFPLQLMINSSAGGPALCLPQGFSLGRRSGWRRGGCHSPKTHPLCLGGWRWAASWPAEKSVEGQALANAARICFLAERWKSSLPSDTESGNDFIAESPPVPAFDGRCVHVSLPQTCHRNRFCFDTILVRDDIL